MGKYRTPPKIRTYSIDDSSQGSLDRSAANVEHHFPPRCSLSQSMSEQIMQNTPPVRPVASRETRRGTAERQGTAHEIMTSQVRKLAEIIPRFNTKMQHYQIHVILCCNGELKARFQTNIQPQTSTKPRSVFQFQSLSCW